MVWYSHLFKSFPQKDFLFMGSKITPDSDYIHKIRIRLLVGQKAMTIQDSVLKSRDITLPTKVCIVKAMVFPVRNWTVESWTVEKVESEVTQSCLILCNPIDCSLPGSSVLEDSPGENTGVDCHFLLQGIFPTQGSNPGLPHCRQMLYRLSHQGIMMSTLIIMLIGH